MRLEKGILVASYVPFLETKTQSAVSINAESSEYHQLQGASQFSDLRIQPMLDERLCRYLIGYVNVLSINIHVSLDHIKLPIASIIVELDCLLK